MRRKCRSCLCRTCIDSCECGNCKGKIKECRRYNGFQQLSIFEQPEPKYQKAPRYSWEHYGITKERYRQLTEYIQSGRYAVLTSQTAHKANKDIAAYIVKSIAGNKSYDQIEYDLELGRIPCGRTDFYGWRRYTFSLLDKEFRRIGK